MAVGKLNKKNTADINQDGTVDSADARLRLRQEEGLEKDTYAEKTPSSGSSSGTSSESSAVSLMAESLLDKIMENNSFSYDVNADPIYEKYRKLYNDDAKRNAEDIFGLAASLTGGYGNSYGLTLARDALGQADERLEAKKEELEKDAYERKQNETASLYKLLDALYEKEDRDIKKNEALFDFALKAADMGDYSYLTELGIDTSGAELSDESDMAELFAKYGDTSLLEALGIDVSSFKDEKNSERAELFAKYGDTSLLEALGIDVSSLKDEKNSDRAELFAKYGDTSLLEEMGVDVSQLKRDELKELAELFARYGDYSLLRLLGADTSNKEEEDRYDLLTLMKKYKKL